MNRSQLLILMLSLGTFLAVLTACTTPSPGSNAALTEQSGPASADVSSVPTPAGPAQHYPAPASEDSYPPPDSNWIGPAIGSQAGEDQAYPGPDRELTTDGVRFTIDRPLQAGQTTVTGSAPENTYLALSDLTYAGLILGEGQSDSMGHFSITVTPLIEGNRVGLTVSAAQGGQSMVEFAQEYYPFRGEGYIEVPNIGIFFDSVLVEP
jgi:hypothetical protein